MASTSSSSAALTSTTGTTTSAPTTAAASTTKPSTGSAPARPAGRPRHTGYIPAPIAAAGGSTLSNWQKDYGIVLGIPGVTQVAYTRTGQQLNLNPPNTPAFDQSTIPFYNLYVSDSWRIKPTLTLSYGLGWSLEMPPVEAQGKQIELVDANNKPLDTEKYLQARESAALQGQVYNPQIGFSLIDNVAGKPKYPYNPFYKGFSPRVAAAWNPHFDGGLLGDLFGENKTVIRGGYSILYGRLNGVGLVLIPLLGDGLIQAVQCVRSPTAVAPARLVPLRGLHSASVQPPTASAA